MVLFVINISLQNKNDELIIISIFICAIFSERNIIMLFFFFIIIIYK